MSGDCLFCKIISGEIPSSKVYQDNHVVAFLDIFPLTKGHTVVVPFDHYETILDFPEDQMKNYFSVIKRLTGQIKTKLNADGINIMQNNFKAAGQLIFHMHYHIIPRWTNDNRLFIKQPKEQATPEYLADMIKLIKEGL